MSTTVLVIGAGASGMRAAYDLAEAGAQVLLIDRSPVIGGALAPRLNGDGADWEYAGGVKPPLTREIQEHARIEVLTLAEVVSLTGQIGGFRATIHQGARYVTDACTHCNHCRSVCPVVRSNAFQANLTHRKAIYLPLEDGVPSPYVIDIESCLNDPPNYLPCQRCVGVCDDNAITFDAPIERVLERQVSSVILAAGFESVPPTLLDRYGYGAHPDVLTSMELDRLMTPAGPTGGDVEKPSNGANPESVLLYMLDSSKFSWNYTAYQTKQLVEQDINDITVVYPSNEECGADFDAFWSETAAAGVKLVRGTLEKVQPDNEDDTLTVRYRETDLDRSVNQTVDVVVLTNAPKPPEGLEALSKILQIKLKKDGYVRSGGEKNNGGGITASTTRLGVFVVGCASGPKNIAESMADIKSVVERALYHVEMPADSESETVESERVGVTVGGRKLSEDDIQTRFEQLVSNIVALGERNAGE
jgi:heterodisulfide reductase subunit A2